MRGILTAVLAALIGTGSAQAQTIVDLAPGQPMTRAPAPGRDPELFRFLGEPGQIVRLSIEGAGPFVLQLHEPKGGAVMRQASGADTVQLEAILPLDGVYLTSVIRGDPSKPYKIVLRRGPSDPYFAHFVEGVGYAVTGPGATQTTVGCWLEPGARLRVTHPGGAISVVTLGRGAKRFYTQTAGATSARFESETRFEGDDAVTTYQGLPGGDRVERQTILPEGGTWTYRAYQCP